MAALTSARGQEGARCLTCKIDLVKFFLEKGGCLFSWINLMFLRPFTMVWASVLTLVFYWIWIIEIKSTDECQNIIMVNGFGFSKYCLQDFKCFLYSNFNDFFSVAVGFKIPFPFCLFHCLSIYLSVSLTNCLIACLPSLPVCLSVCLSLLCCPFSLCCCLAWGNFLNDCFI